MWQDQIRIYVTHRVRHPLEAKLPVSVETFRVIRGPGAQLVGDDEDEIPSQYLSRASKLYNS